MRALILIATLVTFAVPSFANEIYIDQIGDTLDLDITQDGQNNEFGDSTTDIDLDGDTMTFDITQTGDTNIINAVIQGDTYTGTWVFTGSGNQVDLKCDSSAAGNCQTVTLDITTTGDDNLFELNIGENNDASSSTIEWTITGDGNVLMADVDGASANVNVTVDNSATGSGTTVTDVASGNSTDAGGVMVIIDQDGDGDVSGHSVTLDITGGGSKYDITQSGIYDNTVDGTFSGDDQEVTIIQSD